MTQPADTVFAAEMAAFYDDGMGPMFQPYAADMAARASGLASGAVLEVAAGTGIVTAALVAALPETVAITATDLNRPMLDFAAAKPGMERVRWRQADAQALPFADASFDLVICQFGVMFFPDKPRAHGEARRVLKPGGRYLFSVWDSLAHNPSADVIEEALSQLYPQQPPRFLSRMPYSYFDPDRIRVDLRAGGFAEAEIAPVTLPRSAATPREVATGQCSGSPLRGEIEAADPGGLDRAIDAVVSALAARFGDAPTDYPHRALVIEARR